MGAALPAGACAARMLLFVGGPSTEGAGKVVDRELSESIRSHEVGWHASLIAETNRPVPLDCWVRAAWQMPEVLRSWLL